MIQTTDTLSKVEGTRAKKKYIEELNVPQFYDAETLYSYLLREYSDEEISMIFLCMGGIIRSRKLFFGFKEFIAGKSIENIHFFQFGFLRYEKLVKEFENFVRTNNKKVIVIANSQEYFETLSFLLLLIDKLKADKVQVNLDEISSGNLSSLGIDLIIVWKEDQLTEKKEWDI